MTTLWLSHSHPIKTSWHASVSPKKGRIDPVSGKITMSCVEKVAVNTNLVQICESINTFNIVSILKWTRLGS